MAFQNEDLAKKYGKFLGNNSFFTDSENRDLCNRGDFVKLREKFRLIYQDSLKSIGFNHFDIETVKHYYDILFAASHPTAIAFWHKATAIKYDGQRTLF
jgi:hypothetical protein